MLIADGGDGACGWQSPLLASTTLHLIAKGSLQKRVPRSPLLLSFSPSLLLLSLFSSFLSPQSLLCCYANEKKSMAVRNELQLECMYMHAEWGLADDGEEKDACFSEAFQLSRLFCIHCLAAVLLSPLLQLQLAIFHKASRKKQKK